MIIAGMYSLKEGRKVLEGSHPNEFQEVRDVITALDSELYRTKLSDEPTKRNKLLYAPKELNSAVKTEFNQRGWMRRRVKSMYSTDFYTEEYTPASVLRGAFREMDYEKHRVGVEVQFGKYAFMVYNICAKMTIFKNKNIIDVGIEVVPIKAFADQMSTGVSYFEQLVWDLETRGIADIDVPVLVIGIMSSNQPVKPQLPDALLDL